MFQSKPCSSILKLMYFLRSMHHKTFTIWIFSEDEFFFKKDCFRDFLRLCALPPTVSVIILHYALWYQCIQIFSLLLWNGKELPAFSQWSLDPLSAMLSVLDKKRVWASFWVLRESFEATVPKHDMHVISYKDVTENTQLLTKYEKLTLAFFRSDSFLLSIDQDKVSRVHYI